MRCLLKALTLIHLVYETTHAPSGVCPSQRYCTPCNDGGVVCSLDSLENITSFLNFGATYLPVDNLIISSCGQLKSTPKQLNVKSLKLNCSSTHHLQAHVSLFQLWNPFLESIANDDFIYKNNVLNGIKTCQSICNRNTIAPIKNSSLCICITQTQYNGDSNMNSTYFYNNQTINCTNCTDSGNCTNCSTVVDGLNYYHLLSIGSVSVLTFLVNFVILTTICFTNGTKLIDVFGIALMMFNILLSLYGVGLAVYLWQSHTEWHQRFCQGLTSIKLFALGASVWTLLMLTYHRKIRGDIDEDTKDEDKKEDKEKKKEEKEKKKKETDAIFKGIVYILEGLMLSGVLAVMSWIKLDRWEYLCIIFEPKTTVDWLLTGIELFYYFSALCLILRFPYNLIKKRRKLATTEDNQTELINKKRKDKEKEKKDKSHTIFLIVLVSFIIWVTGYVMTLPRFGMFTDKLRRVIRVGAVIFPLSIQPIMYVLRNTCCCLCPRCSCKKNRNKDEQSSDHCVLLVCECTGSETCPACESEYMEQYGNTQFDEREANGGTQKQKKKTKQNKKEKKKKKKRKNDVIEPKSIERSPRMRQRNISLDEAVADTPLLENDNAIETDVLPLSLEKPSTYPTESMPLLDDTDGTKLPPKATPDGTPIKVIKPNTTTEFPSFINMESAVDVDSLPKEKTPPKLSKLAVKSTSMDEEGRKSRGPTFFPLAEKNNSAEEKSKKKLKKKHEKEKNNHDTDSKKVKRKKSKEKDESSNLTTNNERNSTISLEWDHYSDSSGSISRGSDCYPDEMVVGTTKADNTTKQNNCNHQNNGISGKTKEVSCTAHAPDLNKNTSGTLVQEMNKKPDLVNQNSNGKVTSSV